MATTSYTIYQSVGWTQCTSIKWLFYTELGSETNVFCAIIKIMNNIQCDMSYLKDLLYDLELHLKTVASPIMDEGDRLHSQLTLAVMLK